MLSSWAEQNVDPSLFSRELMSNASYLVGDEEVALLDYQLYLLQTISIGAILCDYIGNASLKYNLPK